MTATEQAPPPAPRLTRSGSRWRALLLAAVAACAACGIVYELALLTLSASLHGGGVVAMSLIVAGYVAALGAGALLVKPLLHRAAVTFIAVETALAVIGGSVSGGALRRVRVRRRLAVGARGGNRAHRKPGRRRGPTADDPAAARPHIRGRLTPGGCWPT